MIVKSFGREVCGYNNFVARAAFSTAAFLIISQGEKMNKLLKSLIFPAVALLIIAMIYSSLSIENLNQKTAELSNQNQNLIFTNDQLKNQFNQQQVKIDQISSLTNQLSSQNQNLISNLVAAKNQISALRSTKSLTVNTISTPETITKIITQTIDQPVVLNQATLTIENIGSYKVDIQSGDNAFLILQRAAAENNFALNYQSYSFGVFVTGIGNINPTGNNYWAFYYNGVFSNVGASDQPVKTGDNIVWQLASF